MTARKKIILKELQKELQTKIDWRSVDGKKNRANILKIYGKWLLKEEIIEMKNSINCRRASCNYKKRPDDADDRVKMEILILMATRDQLIMEKRNLEQDVIWFQNASW